MDDRIVLAERTAKSLGLDSRLDAIEFGVGRGNRGIGLTRGFAGLGRCGAEIIGLRDDIAKAFKSLIRQRTPISGRPAPGRRRRSRRRRLRGRWGTPELAPRPAPPRTIR